MPGVVRDSAEWCELYKKRCVVERSINHFKSVMCVADRKSRDPLTSKSDFLFAAIAQLFTVIVASVLKKPALCRSLKPLYS